MDLYIQPFVHNILFEGRKLVQNIEILLKEKDYLSKGTFNLLFKEKNEIFELMKESKKVVNRGKFMGLSIWISKLISIILENVQNQNEKMIRDKSLNQKFLTMMKELEIDERKQFKSSDIYKRADMVINEILKLKSEVVIEKKKYQENVLKINQAFNNVMDSKDTQAILEQFQHLKQKSSNDVKKLQSKIEEMEKLISRIDHERRAFRDENEFFSGENNRLKNENISYRVKNLELVDMLKHTNDLKEQYFNISLMQISEMESEKKRTMDKQTRYLKLRQEHEDLKHELTLLVKERQVINAANREENFKKEEILIGLARRIVPGVTSCFNLRVKSGPLTIERNGRMFAKDINLMKPSYFSLISNK